MSRLSMDILSRTAPCLAGPPRRGLHMACLSRSRRRQVRAVALIIGLLLGVAHADAQRAPTRPAPTRPAARGSQGPAERLAQSTRPTRYVGSFRSRDAIIAITDVGFSIQAAR